MAAKKEKTKAYTTILRGKVINVNLRTPVEWDKSAGKNIPSKDKGKARYRVRLIVDGDTASKFEEAIVNYAQENGIKKPDYTIKPQTDKETGEETGDYIIGLQAYGYDNDGKLRRPPALFDAAAKPLPKGFHLSGGSDVKVSVAVTTRQMPKPGVSFWMNSIQVINLADGQSHNPFEAEEGFTYEEPEAETDSGDDDPTDF